MSQVFLSGGGGVGPELDGFLSAAMRAGRRRVLVLVAAHDAKVATANALGYRDAFRARGVPVSESASLEVSGEAPLTLERLRELDPTGVFVAGGLTSHYWDALCRDPSWIEHVLERELPYAGFSAGAAIASREASLGGWRVERQGRLVEVTSSEVSEQLDALEVRPGLGLVPFAVDAHASQWGTVSRILHAVERGLVPEAVAIDEHTVLRLPAHATWEGASVRGRGVVYRVRREGPGLRVVLLEEST